MAFKSILQLLAQADATLPDNSTQLITAAAVRNMVKDFLDSMSPAYGAIHCTSVVETLAPLTPQVLAPYTTTIQATAPDFTTNLTNGSVTRVLGAEAGSTIQILASGAVVGGNGDAVTVTLFRNGAATTFANSVTAQGGGNPVSFNIAAIDYVTTDSTYDLRAVGPAGSYTFSELTIVCQKQPVRSF
jgi:hypothetical protein